MNIIILSNGPGLPEVVSLYGHSSQWIPDSINQKNINYTVIKTYDNMPFDYSNADAFIITGSKYSVYDNAKWIDNLKLRIDDIIKLGKPVLGICFGHQLLASCLGGRVEKNVHGWELGSYEISLTKEGRISPLFNSFNNNDVVYESHQDVVLDLPADAVELAYSNKGNQSFSYDDFLYGVQFHPEFSYDVTRKLMDLRLDRGVKIDSDVLLKSINGIKILTNFINIVKRSI
tara:strand:+ start:852 stop:1544 length:693 start_codon:yes stop_codon:yes gene_type:complete